jgi:ABC-type phosphate transport system, periplasmic component
LTNQAGTNSWPIVATTFILLPSKPSPQRQAALKFFNWVFKHGAAMARKMDYVAMPDSVIKQITAEFKN